MVEETYLSSSVTIAKYREFEAAKDRVEISRFIRQRFSERYITPLRGSEKHGFCTMAISCLMIEALESFWQGWPDTRKHSRESFCSFFKRCESLGSPLRVFSGIADDFYKGVRCGILHQAETTRGWRIRRKGPLYSPETKTINATEFHNKLEEVLERYCSDLQNADWDSDIWRNLRSKMDAVVKNCNP